MESEEIVKGCQSLKGWPGFVGCHLLNPKRVSPSGCFRNVYFIDADAGIFSVGLVAGHHQHQYTAITSFPKPSNALIIPNFIVLSAYNKERLHLNQMFLFLKV